MSMPLLGHVVLPPWSAHPLQVPLQLPGHPLPSSYPCSYPVTPLQLPLQLPSHPLFGHSTSYWGGPVFQWSLACLSALHTASVSVECVCSHPVKWLETVRRLRKTSVALAPSPSLPKGGRSLHTPHLVCPGEPQTNPNNQIPLPVKPLKDPWELGFQSPR